MRVIIAILICMSSFTAYSQNVDIFGGPNINRFYGTDGGAHFNAKYHPGNGFSAGFGIDSVKLDWLRMRITLQFDKYQGEFKASDGGLGGGYSTSAKIEKSVISLGAFPLNFSVRRRFHINVGLEASGLLNESFSGTKSSWILVQTSTGLHPETNSQDLNKAYGKFSSRTNFGLKARVAYDIVILKNICLTPQYMYYYGLSREFKEFPEVTKSMRHSFCLGIKRKVHINN